MSEDNKPISDEALALLALNEEDNAQQIEGFEAREETTSPEVYRGGARFHHEIHKGQNPMALVASRLASKRREVSKLLTADGWDVTLAEHADDVIEFTRVRKPHIVLVDSSIIELFDVPIPEKVHLHSDLTPVRLIAFLDLNNTAEIAGAIADGFDDFIGENANPVEILARAASNLRACRTMSLLEKKQRDAASLLELSQALASSLDLQLILHTVSRMIAEVIDVERCSIVVVDPENQDAIMVAASEDRTVRDLRIRMDDYPELRRCVATAAPVIIADTENTKMFEGSFERLRGKNVRSMALFPVVFEERVTGVLFLRNTKPGLTFNDHEMQFGKTVASACAVAIRNARLFDSFRDQNERINYMRIAAERQMESLKKYEDSFEHAADGMAIATVEGVIRYVNREGRRLLGREDGDLRTHSFLEYISPESRLRWPAIVDQVRHGRYREAFDLYVLLPDGSERIFWLSAGGVGQDTGLLVLSYRDVTETREMEVELRTTKEFLENLIDNSVDAIVASDMSGNLMLFNKGAEELYGYEAKDVIGRLHVSELYPAGTAPEIMSQLRDVRWGGRGRLQAQRKEILDANGQSLPVSMTASIIYEDEEEVATVGVLSDLRDRIRIERRLSDAQDKLMLNEKARVAAQLAGMAAHELNQPLTSVLGYAEMLRHRIEEGDVRRRKPVDVIFTQAERMAKIVRKIGQITKYETKHYGGSSEIINLDAASTGGPAPGKSDEKPEKDFSVSAKETQRMRIKDIEDYGGIIRPDSINDADRRRRLLSEESEPEVTGKMRPAPRGDAPPAPKRRTPPPLKKAQASVPTAEKVKTGETHRFQSERSSSEEITGKNRASPPKPET